MLTKISEHVDQTLKLLHLKYYDRTMTRSIKNHFLRCLLPKVPFEIYAFKFIRLGKNIEHLTFQREV